MNEAVVTSASFLVMRLIAQEQERRRKQPRKRRWPQFLKVGKRIVEEI